MTRVVSLFSTMTNYYRPERLHRNLSFEFFNLSDWEIEYIYQIFQTTPPLCRLSKYTALTNNGAARGVTMPVNLFERVRRVVYVFCPGERESWITQRLFLSWDKTSSVCFVNVRQGNEQARVFNTRSNGLANKSGDQLTRLLFEPDFDRLLFPSRARRFPFSLSMAQLANICYREGKAFLFEKKIYHYRLSYLWCAIFRSLPYRT